MSGVATVVPMDTRRRVALEDLLKDLTVNTSLLERIEELERENKKLRGDLEDAQRARRTLRHAFDEMAVMVVDSIDEPTTVAMLQERGGDRQLCLSCNRPPCHGCATDAERRAEYAAEVDCG